MLAAAWPELQIVAECEHGPAAVEAIDEHAPDIAFLDIRMPGLSGLDVARAASGRCHTVFTTAYDSHAIAAFDAGAVDYLLKPIAADRLAQTVARLRERLAGRRRRAGARRTGRPPGRCSCSRARPAPAAARRCAGSAPASATRSRCSASTRSCSSRATRSTPASSPRTDEAHVRKPLKEIAEGLDPDDFWQVHRGVIVRAAAIARAQRDELGRITLHLKHHAEKLAVSQAYAWRFKPM